MDSTFTNREWKESRHKMKKDMRLDIKRSKKHGRPQSAMDNIEFYVPESPRR